VGACYICWRGHLLIRRWAVQTSQEEPSRIISEVFPRLFRFFFNSQSWGRAALKLRTTQNSATIMGLLKSIWNGFGDLYDSVENTSGNDSYEDNNRYTEPYENNDRYTEPRTYSPGTMWMYKIHLYGSYYTANHNRRWVSEEIFETPEFDLQDRAYIRRLVRLRYPDAVDCDSVQVFFHGQEWK